MARKIATKDKRIVEKVLEQHQEAKVFRRESPETK